MNYKTLFESRAITSGGPSIDGYLSHIKHLSSPAGLCRILKENHSIAPSEAKNIAKKVAPFIQQALTFYYYYDALGATRFQTVIVRAGRTSS